jgi:hypothetical protein
MMGLPEGHVTGHGLSAAQELKILGNGVVPQQAALALRMLMGLPAVAPGQEGQLLRTPDFWLGRRPTHSEIVPMDRVGGQVHLTHDIAEMLDVTP